METTISAQGILNVQALAMTKRIFEQIENRPPKRDGILADWGSMKPTEGLIGFVRDPAHLQMVYFIGKTEDRLWKVRQDDLEEWLLSNGTTTEIRTPRVAHLTRVQIQDKLPQIFLK